MSHPDRNIILYVGKIHDYIIRAIRGYEKKHHKKFRIALLLDSKNKPSKKTLSQLEKKNIDLFLTCDTTSDVAIQKMLLPIKDELLVISTHGDIGIPMLSRIVPHVPYLKTASAASLYWATNKIWMRRRLYIHNKKEMREGIEPSSLILQTSA